MRPHNTVMKKINRQLLSAASYGDTGRVMELLDAGADIEYGHGDGKTALMYAAKYGYVETVEVLLAAGAIVTVQDLHSSSRHVRPIVACALTWQARKTWIMLFMTKPSRHHQLEAVIKIGAVFVVGVAVVVGARCFGTTK